MHWIDPECLPETKGKVERFVMNPHGEINGLVLNGSKTDTKFVHVPPHMGAEIEAAIQPGDEIGVRGVRPRGSNIIAAVALITSDGRSIVDQGPDHKPPHQSHKPPAIAKRAKGLTVFGKVRLSLHAPKGELRGALLDNGSIVRIGPKEATRFEELLRPGASLAVSGDGIETHYGPVIDAKEIGSDLDHLKRTKGPQRG
jgi:hypothetical protein